MPYIIQEPIANRHYRAYVLCDVRLSALLAPVERSYGHYLVVMVTILVRRTYTGLDVDMPYWKYVR